MNRIAFLILLAVTMLCAFALRIGDLETRPMHGDEAVHAVKLDELLRTGTYVYDPHEYHGPTLYYATVPVCWLTGVRDLSQMHEWMLRVVPLIFGIALIALLPLVADGLGRWPALLAALLIAVSHAFVFYSRYYIQETLLVFFTFAAIACAWRWLRSGRIAWAVAAGAALGLTHATKETCIIAIGCGGLATVGAWLWSRRDTAPKPHAPRDDQSKIQNPTPQIALGVAAALATAALVSITLFSAFFTQAAGPLNSLLTFATYFDRAGNHGLHNHPWWFYLQRIAFTRLAAGPIFSEAAILLLGFIGARAIDREPRSPIGLDRDGLPFRRFILLYTLLMTLVYSAIPYKTPWCALGFLHGWALLAGVGVVKLAGPTIHGGPRSWIQFERVSLVLSLFGGWLKFAGSQAVLGSERMSSDNRNPYVYAHPIRSVIALGEFVERVADAQPDRRATLTKVFMHDSWPVPWYLRHLSRVGFWDQIPEEPRAPIIVADEALQSDLQAALGAGYRAFHYGLRPDARLVVLVSDEAWRRFEQSQPATSREAMPTANSPTSTIGASEP